MIEPAINSVYMLGQPKSEATWRAEIMPGVYWHTHKAPNRWARIWWYLLLNIKFERLKNG